MGLNVCNQTISLFLNLDIVPEIMQIDSVTMFCGVLEANSLFVF